jgi:RNA polymerase primary sigma factor
MTRRRLSAGRGETEPQKEEALEKGFETPDAPLPLPDLSGGAFKQFIKQAKKRGYVTYEQLNAVMPSEEVTSEQIEDILAMLNEMGINVVGCVRALPTQQSRGQVDAGRITGLRASGCGGRN